MLMEKYIKATFGPTVESIDNYRCKFRLSVFPKSGKALIFEGYDHQFEITKDRIIFYEDGLSGHDMPRTRGQIVFICPMPPVFMETEPTEKEIIDFREREKRDKEETERMLAEEDAVMKKPPRRFRFHPEVHVGGGGVFGTVKSWSNRDDNVSVPKFALFEMNGDVSFESLEEGGKVRFVDGSVAVVKSINPAIFPPRAYLEFIETGAYWISEQEP